MQYAKQNGYRRNNYACDVAASGWHIDVVDWIRRNGGSWKPNTSLQAAKGGHLGMLAWLRERGCPRGTSTTYEAAKAGHRGVLKWLRSPEAEEDRWW